MRKLAKPSKPAKLARKINPEDQLQLKTACAFCSSIFPNPTAACGHLDQEHPGEYAR